MFISLHLPKTAGTSFQKSLILHFGATLLRDYSDLPFSKPRPVRNAEAQAAGIRLARHTFDGVNCIHGHFLPVKYFPLSIRKKLTFVTWLRHPVERMVSHYRFWQSIYDANASPPHHRKVIEEEWSLERFCLSGEHRNIYTQFLWGVSLDLFEFVGITERYDEDFDWFSRTYFQGALRKCTVNVGGRKADTHDLDTGLRKEIEQYHAEDMRLYEDALQRRERRLRSG